MTELLRREYPDAVMVNGVVWPFQAGEVCVQNYNSILTLSKLVLVCAHAPSGGLSPSPS